MTARRSGPARGAPEGGRLGRRAGSRVSLALAAALAIAPGCDLDEVSIAAPEEVVVAEVHLRWEEGSGDARALLHRSIGHASEPIRGATVRIRDAAGREESFDEVERNHCLARAPSGDFAMGCYRLMRGARGIVQPGGEYHVTVELASGERLEGRTRMPGEFTLLQPAASACRLPADTRLPLAWTPAAGAWAYVPEASLEGLREALRSEGIQVRTDPVVLVGLSVSEADTTITFPSEFGIFNRLSGDADLLLALQGGLPSDVSGRIVVAALDRNATNWSRGGGFNPSGWVRIPSMFGDGTGVVASSIVQGVEIESDPDGGLPPCLEEEP